MAKRSQIWAGLVSAIGMLVLIMDSQTALAGATEGITLCIQVIIPALFPFIILSIMLNSIFLGKKARFLAGLGKLCGIPIGSEFLLLLGIIGGYPVGAQSIYHAYESGQLNEHDAKRMLGFCNNAGPAFIFGMVGSLYSSATVSWVIWGIHILSALIVGMILPHKSTSVCSPRSSTHTNITWALERGIRVTATICGWVILFRMILSILDRWLLWIFPTEIQQIFYGLLELSNGCHSLHALSLPGMRFIFSCCFLATGGSCIAMQTASVTKELGIGTYLYGKLLQCCFSFFLSYVSQYFLFFDDARFLIPASVLFVIALFTIIIVTMVNRKKVVAIFKPFVYNNIKTPILR